jgi:hypothetical protein
MYVIPLQWETEFHTHIEKRISVGVNILSLFPFAGLFLESGKELSAIENSYTLNIQTDRGDFVSSC